MTFEEQLLLNYDVYGIVFIKMTTDKDGNITEEIIDQDNIHKQYYEQLKVVEYFKKKPEK